MSAFTFEQYKHRHKVYDQRMQKFDGTFDDPSKTVGILVLNLYDSKPACFIYTPGLDQHIRCHGYIQSKAEPCLYYKNIESGQITVSVTVDDFVITAPTDDDIDSFIEVLKLKYEVKDLGDQSMYLGWTVKKAGPHQTHISQPILIDKLLSKHGYTMTHRRKTPTYTKAGSRYDIYTPSSIAHGA